MADTGFIVPTASSNTGTGSTGTSPTITLSSGAANVQTSNNTYDTIAHGSGTNTSNYIHYTNFNTSSIPSGATINGIELIIERKASATNRISDEVIQLVIGGTRVGTNQARATKWPTTDTDSATYGGAANLWGATVTYADVVTNASTFGIAVKTTNNAAGSVTGSIDFLRIRITYTASGNTFNDTITESITLGDSYAAVATFNPPISEAITLGQTFSVALTAVTTISEGVTLGDSYLPGLVMAATLSEAITLGDSLASSATFNAPISEGITLGDSHAANATFNTAITEILTLGDSMSGGLLLVSSITESITLGDSYGAAATLVTTVSEPLTLGDSYTVSATLNAAISEGISLSDSLAASATMNASISEGITLGDSYTGDIAGGGGTPTNDPFRGFLVNTGRLMRVSMLLLSMGGWG